MWQQAENKRKLKILQTNCIMFYIFEFQVIKY